MKNPNKIDYLMIRTEDLIKSGTKTKYDVLLALSNFVGSPRSKEELCCLSYKQSNDYGKSTKHVADGGGVRGGGGPVMTKGRLFGGNFKPKFLHQNQRRTSFASAASATASAKDVTTRYGKWQQVLENNTRLSEYFYKEGAEGLKVFGYHPYTEIRYNIDDDEDNSNYNYKKKNESSTTSSSSSTQEQQQEQEQEQEFICTREILLTMTC
jgi:hypothetical protein